MPDYVDSLASNYSAAFPTADIEAFRTHLAVVRTGNKLSQNVSQYLAANFNINTSRYSLLRALYFTPDKRLPQSEVARAMNVTSPNVTQLIDALEREGLVERVVSETDRRVSYAQLTAEGRAKCAILVPAMAKYMQETSAGLNREEMLQLTKLLAKLRTSLDQTTTEA
jgi:MarR family 2-MHQ and catechol resistance regulon transcriptional repressor